MYLPLFEGVLCWSLFWYSSLCVLSSFAINMTRKRELVALLLLSFRCLVTVNVLWPFLTVSWVGLRCVNVVFPDLNFRTCFDQVNTMLVFPMCKMYIVYFVTQPNMY